MIEELLGKKFDVLDDGFVRVVDYMVNGRMLSALEVKMLSTILKEGKRAALAYGASLGWLDEAGKRKKRVRELSEFEAKAQEIGLVLPWYESS